MYNKLNDEIQKGIGELPKRINFIVFSNSFVGTLPLKPGSNRLLKDLTFQEIHHKVRYLCTFAEATTLLR